VGVHPVGFLLRTVLAEAEDDVAALAATFTLSVAVATISEANRRCGPIPGG